jgi:hypothetical protein
MLMNGMGKRILSQKKGIGSEKICNNFPQFDLVTSFGSWKVLKNAKCEE